MYGRIFVLTLLKLKIKENFHASATEKYIKKYFRTEIFNGLYKNRNLILKFNYREKIINVIY